MKSKLIVFLFMVGMMFSCTTIDVKNTGETIGGEPISEFKYKGHIYIKHSSGITHAGHCKCN